jgi:hypothetical protein
MAEKMEAFCQVCRHIHLATGVSEEEAAIIAEDAQSEAEYFRMDEHLHPKTGLRCEGSGDFPESLAIGDDEDPYDTIGDIDLEEM